MTKPSCRGRRLQSHFLAGPPRHSGNHPPPAQVYHHININSAPSLLGAPVDAVSNLSTARHGAAYYNRTLGPLGWWYGNNTYDATSAEVGPRLQGPCVCTYVEYAHATDGRCIWNAVLPHALQSRGATDLSSVLHTCPPNLPCVPSCLWQATRTARSSWCRASALRAAALLWVAVRLITGERSLRYGKNVGCGAVTLCSV